MRQATVDVRTLPNVAAEDTELVSALAALVNGVYAVAESGLWQDGATRTTPQDMARHIGAGQIAIAEADRQIVGIVHIQRLDSGEGEFGMLAADPAHRGRGIGSALVGFAERWSRHRGIDTMQLELLVPRYWRHPSKDFLAAWYARIGYRPVRSGQMDEHYPDLATYLATPCDFVVYHKSLPAIPSAVGAQQNATKGGGTT